MDTKETILQDIEYLERTADRLWLEGQYGMSDLYAFMCDDRKKDLERLKCTPLQ